MDTTREAQGMAQQAAEAAQKMGERAKAAGGAAWEKAKTGYNTVQDKTVAGVKATDRVIRDNPYQSIGIAFGVGVLLGFLLRKK